MREGHRSEFSFADELNRFAARRPDPGVSSIAAGISVPVRIGVRGRPGVGRRTVARALAGAEAGFVTLGESDLICFVMAEVVKPEDVAALADLTADRRPALAVLNKADLASGAKPEVVSARIGAPVLPAAAVFAVAALDSRLDAGVRAVLRKLSGIDTLVARLAAAGALLRYQRILDATAQLTALAVADGRIADFLSSDRVVVARMAAAAQVIRFAGISRGPNLRQAVRWWRHHDAPLAMIQRACAADIARGSLRPWSPATL